MRRQIKFSNSRPLTFHDGQHDPNINVIWNGQWRPDQCGSGAIAARQDGACPLPGGGNGLPSVPAVTFNPGPPGPLCTADCGKLCTGFYCEPNPTGTPPDFTVPATSTGLTDLPTLPPSTPTSCDTGSTTSSTVQCVGNNGHSACVTKQVCTKVPQPTAQPTDTPKDPGMFCYREHNEDGKYKPFTITDAQGLYFSTCNSGLDLITNGLGFIGGPTDEGLYFSIKWSDNQEGCKGKKAFALADNCHEPMGEIGRQCDLPAGDESKNYGGLYRQNGEYGCVEFLMRRL
ncbi:hypothetical protein BJ170DRAFT_105283 [Xylariales sp. AK1849]|nr:hypothetical protein BJ170DRAFT_105283 [Xylariales sp. AK1849]